MFNSAYFGRKELTDREILKALFPFSDDINKVRPRISELHKEGAFKEVGQKVENGMTVRVSAVAFPVKAEPQVSLLEGI